MTKLAELLIQRKDLKTKLSSLNGQMLANVRLQEGDVPNESPENIALAYHHANQELEEVITTINLLNTKTTVEKFGFSLTQAIEKREAFRREHRFYDNAIKQVEDRIDMYSRSEIRLISTIDAKEYRKKRDQLAKAIRELDIAIQETNWNTEA